VFDSVLIANSVGMNGAKFHEVANINIDKKNIHFIHDNDAKGRKIAVALLEKGDSVFLWQKYIKDKKLISKKDISELIVANNLPGISFSYSDIKTYFSNSIFKKALI